MTLIRLDAQHLLWKMHKGYELHSVIPIVNHMKVAEIGTGELHGFDIADSQYPPKDQWNRNVSLGLLTSPIEAPAHLPV